MALRQLKRMGKGRGGGGGGTMKRSGLIAVLVLEGGVDDVG